MPVIATPLRNAFNHISYLVYCEETREAAAVDPFDVQVTLQVAQDHGLTITRILNTHEHWDHAGRNAAVKESTGAAVLVPRGGIGFIEQFDGTLAEGDVIGIGSTETLRVMDTPGHTMAHISLLGEQEERPYLLCGDTLFGAGVGNCGFGGHVETLFKTVERLAAELSPETLIYPGHDYLARNLQFTLHLCPDIYTAAQLLEEAKADLRLTTVAEEREINVFLRLDDPTLRSALANDDPATRNEERGTLFRKLRARRDAW